MSANFKGCLYVGLAYIRVKFKAAMSKIQLHSPVSAMLVLSGQLGARKTGFGACAVRPPWGGSEVVARVGPIAVRPLRSHISSPNLNSFTCFQLD